MPLTYSTTVTQIANGDPANAATANAPHDDLETRQGDIKTFVDDLEVLNQLNFGLVAYSTVPVYWGGTVADSGSGELQIGREVTGEIRYVQPGEETAGTGTFTVPYNNLASFFDVPNTLAAGEVLYFDGGSLDETGRTGAPYTVLSTDIAKGDYCPKWGIPIGKVVGTEFIFAFTGVKLGKAEEAFVNPMAVAASSSMVYGRDYVFEYGDLKVETNAANIRVTVGATDMRIVFFNKAVNNNEVAAATVTDIPVDSVAYVDCDFSVNGTHLTPTVVGTSSYVHAANRIILWWRAATDVETATTEKWLHIVGPNDRCCASTPSYYDYNAGGPNLVKIGGALNSSQSPQLEFEADATTTPSLVRYNSDELRFIDFATGRYLGLATKAATGPVWYPSQEFVTWSGTSTATLVLATSTPSLSVGTQNFKIYTNHSSDTEVRLANDGSAQMDLVLEGDGDITVDGDGNMVCGGAGYHTWSPARTVTTFCGASSWTVMDPAEVDSRSALRGGAITFSPSTSNNGSICMDLTPYLMEGADLSEVEVNVDILAYNSGTIQVTLNVLRTPGDADSAATIESAVVSNWTSAAGHDQVTMTVDPVVPIIKSTYNYYAVLSIDGGSDAANEIEIQNVKCTQSGTTLVRGG